MLTPIFVYPALDGYYEIISGYQRKYAAQQLGYVKSQ
ncbi:ParB N-terminal domain-containing protein [Faecalimonas umbilicata]